MQHVEIPQEGRLYTGSFNSCMVSNALRKAPPALCEASLQPSASQDPDNMRRTTPTYISRCSWLSGLDLDGQQRSCRSYQGHFRK